MDKLGNNLLVTKDLISQSVKSDTNNELICENCLVNNSHFFQVKMPNILWFQPIFDEHFIISKQFKIIVRQIDGKIYIPYFQLFNDIRTLFLVFVGSFHL